MRWLTPFRACCGHVAQQISLGQYINGLLSDSARKSMQAMLARVTAPVRYQAFQHFVTHAPWDAEEMWRILRGALPERTGIVIFDDTGFPKKGDHSVGVARQYTGTLGKIANCQVAVTAMLWSGVRAWLLGAALYLPEDWAKDRIRRKKARVPKSVVFQKKWELALGLLRDALTAGLKITAVLADAGYGDVTAFRAALHAAQLAYAVGIASTTSVSCCTPSAPRAGAFGPGARAASPTPDPGQGPHGNAGQRPGGGAAVAPRLLAQ